MSAILPIFRARLLAVKYRQLWRYREAVVMRCPLFVHTNIMNVVFCQERVRVLWRGNGKRDEGVLCGVVRKNIGRHLRK